MSRVIDRGNTGSTNQLLRDEAGVTDPHLWRVGVEPGRGVGLKIEIRGV